MPIQSGDRLKTEKEFYDLMVEHLNRIDPRAASQAYNHGSTLDTMLRTFAKMMSEQQSDYHHFILSMGNRGVMPGDTVERYRPELEPQPYVKAPCCQPKDLKWYDSGFSKFQYCGVCNKEHK